MRSYVVEQFKSTLCNTTKSLRNICVITRSNRNLWIKVKLAIVSLTVLLQVFFCFFFSFLNALKGNSVSWSNYKVVTKTLAAEKRFRSSTEHKEMSFQSTLQL